MHTISRRRGLQWLASFAVLCLTLKLLGTMRAVAAETPAACIPNVAPGQVTTGTYPLAIARDGRTVVAGSVNGNVLLWDVATGSLLHTLHAHHNVVMCVAYSRDGKYLGTGSADGTGAAFCWDVATGRQLHAFEGHRGEIKSVAFSPDGKMIATGSDWGQILLWDAETGRKLGELVHRDGDIGWPGFVCSIAFTPDGKSLATGSEDKTVAIWDLQTKNRIRTLAGLDGEVISITFSPDGRQLAVGSSDEKVSIWNTSSAQKVGSVEGAFLPTFSQDGKLLAVGFADGDIKLVSWEARHGQQNRVLYRHKTEDDHDKITYAVISPDGTFVAAGGSERPSVSLLDVQTGKLLRTLVDSPK